MGEVQEGTLKGGIWLTEDQDMDGCGRHHRSQGHRQADREGGALRLHQGKFGDTIGVLV